MEDYRDGKLRKLIAHCYKNVPYYRRVMDETHIGPGDVACAEDLELLPVLTKDLMRRYAKELLADNISEMEVSWTKTGGTTGEPLRVCKEKECSAWAAMCYERALGWAGKTVDEPRILLFGGSLGVEQTPIITRIGNALRGDLFIPAFELRADNAAVYFHRIRRSRCRFIVGYPSALYRLAILSKELGAKIRFEAALPTAELLLPEWEDAIRDTFECAVLPFYGCGEVNGLGFSTPKSDGYLIPEEHALIEVMQRDGEAKLYGEGRFLITDLDNYAMPIIRYANGDAGTVSCPRGDFPFSRIDRLDGRYNSLLMTDSGDLISGVIGTHIFRLTTSVKSYRIIQEEPLRVVIKLVPKDVLTDDDRSLICGLFTKYLGGRMSIEIKEVSSLPVPPSGKAVFVVNRCLQASSNHADTL